MGSKFVALIFILFLSILISAERNEEFYEELYVKPLPNGQINTFFQFTTRWKLGPGDNLHNTVLMPRTIAEILLSFDVRELHISLTQGLWRYETWGYPVVDSAPGAEVWAWFKGNLSTEAVNTQWKNLCSTLSGVLCASLNFVDMTNTIVPKYSLKPEFGAPSQEDVSDGHIRYSTLPRENVCTENLTPWKKLLPCNSRSGFASLLNSGSVYNTNYHSLGVKIRTICTSNITENCIIEFKETANIVYDQRILGGTDFSLRKMFGQGMNGACPLAKSSKVYVDVTADNFELTPTPDRTFTSLRGGSTTKFAEYNIKKVSTDKLFNIAWIAKEKSNLIPIIPSPPIFAHRYILGHGQENGKIVTQITNNHWESLNIIFQENIPWYVPCYLHTLAIKVNGKSIKPKVVHFVPGRQREKPYHLELALTIPAKSVLEVSIDFEYIFLKWLEYPPDANHGHYLGSAIISTVLPIARNYTAIPVEGYLFSDSFNASRSGYFIQIRTETLIITLPTPDFSMPYNVICLACTVVALAFGPIHSVATKKIVIECKDEHQSLLARIKSKLFGKKAKVHEGGGDTETKEE